MDVECTRAYGLLTVGEKLSRLDATGFGSSQHRGRGVTRMSDRTRDEVKRSAKLSRCGKYRYALWREWEETLPRVLFIALNPSTADRTRDDPTIRRCLTFACRWGYGSVAVGNLFAYRAGKPHGLKRVADPVGPRNDWWLRRLAAEADLVVAAWGNRGLEYAPRVASVIELLPDLHCVEKTKRGMPWHPLFAPNVEWYCRYTP